MRTLFDRSGACEIVGWTFTYDVLIDMDPQKPYEASAPAPPAQYPP